MRSTSRKRRAKRAFVFRNARFARRFRDVERMARDQGLDMLALTIDALEDLWREAKSHDE